MKFKPIDCSYMSFTIVPQHICLQLCPWYLNNLPKILPNLPLFKTATAQSKSSTCYH